MRHPEDFANPQFADFPEPAEEGAYLRSRSAFIETFAKVASVSAIYQIGSVSEPGISDLDLVLVMRPDVPLESGDLSHSGTLDDRMFVHPPFCVPEDVFPYLNYFFYTKTVSPLWGRLFDFAPFKNPAEKKMILWLIGAEAAIGRLSDILYQLSLRSPISLRKMILKLSSLRHVLLLLDDIGESSGLDRARSFSEEVKEVRRSWFLRSAAEQIFLGRDLTRRGLEALQEIAGKLRDLAPDVVSDPGGIGSPVLGEARLLPHSFQVIKFADDPVVSFRRGSHPLAFLRRLSFKTAPRMTRHLNDPMVIRLAPEFSFLFMGLDVLETRAAGRNQDAAFHFSIVKKYLDFIRAKRLRSFSPLIMWNYDAGNSGSVFWAKRILLKAVVRRNSLA